MNPDLDKLQPYPFEKLAKLKAGIQQPADSHIALSIGEPKHPTPALILEALTDNLDGLAKYPSTKGLAELRQAIADWLSQRFSLPAGTLDIDTQILPVNGTREALFAFAQAVINRSNSPQVLMPNPFYQIYEGAALLAGATPVFLDCLPENGYLPDFNSVDAKTWQQCELIYTCSPGNPTGTVMGIEQLQQLIRLSDQYDFVIASDECYSELYFDELAPPPGLLQAAQLMGREDFKNCVIFHSLSKRSNAPGLRSGFVAGDAKIVSRFFEYRTYHGCAMPIQHQLASIAAWQDENHVRKNRDQYREKFATVIDVLSPVLDVKQPEASFYLWIKTPVSDETFARQLYEQENITVLPGSYLSRENNGHVPGKNHVRLALVATLDECVKAAEKIKRFVENM
jgi:N-succinyldiaminopimelate aminotransferase